MKDVASHYPLGGSRLVIGLVLRQLGNSSVASGSSHPGATVGPSYSQVLISCHFTFLYFYSFLLSSSSVSLPSFITAVPMRKCLGKHSCLSSPYIVKPDELRLNKKKVFILQLYRIELCFFALLELTFLGEEGY